MNKGKITKEAELAYRLDEFERISEHNRKMYEIQKQIITDEMPLWRLNTSELRPDYRPHRCQWSETVKRAFATNIINFILP